MLHTSSSSSCSQRQVTTILRLRLQRRAEFQYALHPVSAGARPSPRLRPQRGCPLRPARDLTWPRDSSKNAMLIQMALHAGINAASVAEAALLMILMLARRVPEQLQTFAQRGLGHPFGMQLLGKTLGIIGMGAIGARAYGTPACSSPHKPLT